MMVVMYCVALIGCSKRENIGSTDEALDGGTAGVVSTNAHSPDIVASRQFLAMSFTGSGSTSRTRWGTFDGGASWSVCDVTNTPAGCNGTGGTPLSSGISTLTHWLGKGAMAADGKGNVVYVTLANNTASPTVANWVVAMVSINDGRQFVNAAQLVNESGGDCDPATEDLPDVTIDQTTSPQTIWFVWRHNGSGTFGGCVRRGVFSSGSIVWLDKVRSVGGMVRENNDLVTGQGGMRIAAGDGIVTIGYSDNDQLQTCSSTSLIPITWGTVSTFDNGADWTWTSKVFHTDHFLSCPFGTIQNGIRAFDFIRAQDGTYYFAVADWDSTGTTSTMHLFMSEGSGVPIDTSAGSLNIVWREFCPNTLSQGADGGPITGSPTANWTAIRWLCTNSPPPFATSGALMFPALASDGMERLSLLYTVAPDRAHFHPRYHGNIAPRTATAAIQTIEPLSATFSASGSSLLDFNSMTAWGAQSPNPCTSAADFFPTWVFADGTSSTLKFTHVNL